MPDRILIDPTICHGKPVIRGTRIPVGHIVGAMAGGDSIDAIIADYPSLTREDVAAALDFAAHLAEREYELIPG